MIYSAYEERKKWEANNKQPTWQHKRACDECGRIFDLERLEDSEEWAYGHDCEVTERMITR